jgi:hypothetical protein
MSLNSIIAWLKPREMVFFDLLEGSVGNLLEASRLFEREFVSRENFSQWGDLRHRMKVLEHAGDEVTHTIVDRLNRTFVTPLEREDILALAHALDDVVDCLDGVCERLVLYKVTSVMPLAAQADAVFHQALAEIFTDPKDPIDLIKWKEILTLLEDATDRIELVSKVVSSTVMRNA